MKHPTYKIIQDYFEGEISDENQKLISHFEDCNKCSIILAQMAKVDILLSRKAVSKPSVSVKQETFLAASKLLELRRKRVNRSKVYSHKIKNLSEYLNNLSKDISLDWRNPFIQISTICILMVVVTKFSTERTYIKKYKLIQDEPQIIYSEFAGD